MEKRWFSYWTRRSAYFSDNVKDSLENCNAILTWRMNQALKAFYAKSWEGVEGRIHEVHKVFPLGQGENALEVMIDGTSHYTFTDGTKGGGKWAARQRYVREDGSLKVKEYAVHFVRCPSVTVERLD